MALKKLAASVKGKPQPNLSRPQSKKDPYEYDADVNVFDRAGKPISDGKHIGLLKCGNKNPEPRGFDWTTNDEFKLPRHDFNINVSVLVTDPSDPDNDRYAYTTVSTMPQKTKSGKYTSEIATLLGFAGVKPTFDPAVDSQAFYKILQKETLQLGFVTEWRTQLVYDAEADEAYIERQKKCVFAKKQSSPEYPRDKDGNAIPLTEVLEDTERQYKAKGVQKTAVFTAGEQLYTTAKVLRFEELESE